MSYDDSAARRFNAEMSSLLDKHVIVKTVAGEKYEGVLLGYETSRYSVVLGDVRDPSGEVYPRVVLYGHVISEIRLTEAPLDMGELARRLEEVFPKMVKYMPEARLILVMDRIRVTERGVEGSGPIAERVRTIYERFVEEWRSKHRT